MKAKLLLSTLFLCYILSANAQSFFLLKNGEIIEAKKYKIKDKADAVEIKKPSPSIIPIKDIDYLVNKNGEVFYIKDRVNYISPLQGDWYTTMDPDYAMMEKFIEGKITIYTYTVSYNAGQYGGQQTVVYSFIEKDDKFEEIFNSELFESGKKKNKEAFSEYFADDTEIRDQLMSEDFKANVKNVLDLIRKYNLRAYDESRQITSDKNAQIILYRGYTNQAKALEAEIEINGEKITLADMHYKQVKVPDSKPVKICVDNGKTEYCDLVSGSQHVIKHYEVQLKLNGEIEVEIKNKKQFQRYLNALNASY